MPDQLTEQLTEELTEELTEARADRARSGPQTRTTTMHALRAHRRGGPETLVFEEAPRPRPAPDEALIEVRAAAITATELTWDLSWTTRNGEDRTPVIPSHEFSGIVVELGEGVTSPAVGSEVYGLVDFDRDGAAAELVTLPAAQVALRPRSVSHVDAAALPLAALTAWQALVDHAGVQPGDRVLVHGGAGGVGAYVVQIAVALGAEVTATATAAQAGFVRGLGASTVINFATTSFVDVVFDVDVVIDTVGGATLDASFGVLRRGGRLVTLAAPPSQEAAAAHGVTATFFVVRPDPGELAHLAAMVDAGQLLSVVAHRFPLADGRAAFEAAAAQTAPGKTVLVVRG